MSLHTFLLSAEYLRLLNNDVFRGPTFTSLSMMPESQPAHSVNAKLNKYIIVHCLFNNQPVFSTAPRVKRAIQKKGTHIVRNNKVLAFRMRRCP